MTATERVTDDEEEVWDPDAEPVPVWETGTTFDEFINIYRALAVHTKTHGPLSPAEVDAMDITLVAVLLGIGAGSSLADVHSQWRAEWEAENGPVGAGRVNV